MKVKIRLVVVTALLAGACGIDPATEPAGHDVPSTVAEASPPPVQEYRQMDVREASLEPVAEPYFKPVPEPVAGPAPKPIRSNLPTPPPTRRRPPKVAPPSVRVPPSADENPSEALAQTDPRVTAAVDDLTLRLGEGVAIDVLDARAVTWRDGSVGCPSPDLAYTHALVPGFLVVLRSDDTSYRYHSAGDLMPFLCDTPRAPLEGSA